MRLFLSTLLLCFCISVNLSAQDSTVNPTEAQGQQVVGGTFLSTCQNYGNVSTRTCYDCRVEFRPLPRPGIVSPLASAVGRLELRQPVG